jgi:hypothetical protein
MSKLSVLLVLIVLILSSCLRSTDEKCKSIAISEFYFQDSIVSGLTENDGIYSVWIKLNGDVENDIRINEFSFPAGSVDTLISNRDQYATTFFYEVKNEFGGKVDLDICVGFAYSPR